MSEEQRRGRGRPPIGGETGKRMNVYLPPDVEEWLRSRPIPISQAISDLVRSEISKAKNTPPE